MNLKLYVRKLTSSVRDIWTFFRGFWLPTAGVLGLSIIYSLLESIGVASLIPLFSLLTSTEGTQSGRIERIVTWFMDLLNLNVTIVTLSIVILSLFLLKSIFHVVSKFSQAYLVESNRKHITDKVFGDLMGVKWEFFISQKRGHLINDLLMQCKNTSIVLQGILKLLSSSASACAYLAAAFFVSPYVTMLALLFLIPASIIWFPLILKTKEAGKWAVRVNKKMSNLIEQYLIGFKDIKSYNVKSETASNIKETTGEFKRSRLLLRILKAGSPVITELLAIFILFGILNVGFLYYQSSFSEIIVVSILFFRVFNKAAKVTFFQNIAQNLASLDEVRDILDQLEIHSEDVESEGIQPSFRESLEVQNLCFKYRGLDQDDLTTLENISFDLRKGEMLGITGESGAGKSTLIDLIMGLLKYEEGEILLDGVDLSRVDHAAWREMIGYVSQDNFLINDTIEKNIGFFRDLSKNQIRQAAELADAHQFIEQTTNGYATKVGEGGVKLSGGQKQRIVLARALAGEIELLVLDEATSHLDASTEENILETLTHIKGELTIISIAHRFSSIEGADNVIVLEEGRIVEQGSPGNLKKKEGVYSELADKQ